MDQLSENQSQITQFDILRGIAIIGVFMVHSQYAIYPNFDFSYGSYFIILPKKGELFKYLSMSPMAFGWLGVILFFIISGFLIHYVTLKKGIENFEAKLFFNKRFWRIYPPYLITLLFFTFANQSISQVIHHPLDFISHLFLVHTFSSEYFFSINGVFWSLAVEVHLYLLYPAFLLIRKKIGLRNTLLSLLAIHIICTFIWWYISNCNNIVLGNFILRHWFTWSIGAFIAECYYTKDYLLSKLPNKILFLSFIIFYLSKLFYFHIITDYLFSTLLIAILVEKLLLKPVSLKVSYWQKAMIPIGLCSYSLYLLHMPFQKHLYEAIDLFHYSSNHKALFWIINTGPVFLILFFISYGSYIFIEQKSSKYGHMFYNKYFLKK